MALCLMHRREDLGWDPQHCGGQIQENCWYWLSISPAPGAREDLVSKE